MIERMLIIAAIVAIVTIIWAGVRVWRGWMLRRLADAAPFAGIVAPGRPAVIGFSTPGCAECRFRQAPALKQLSAERGDQMTVHSLLVSDYPELVDRLGILTAPATVVLDAAGVVRHVNLGFAEAAKLAEQVSSIQSVKPIQRERRIGATVRV